MTNACLQLAGCTASWSPGGLSVIAHGVTGNARDQDEAVELIERAEKGHEQVFEHN